MGFLISFLNYLSITFFSQKGEHKNMKLIVAIAIAALIGCAMGMPVPGDRLNMTPEDMKELKEIARDLLVAEEAKEEQKREEEERKEEREEVEAILRSLPTEDIIELRSMV